MTRTSTALKRLGVASVALVTLGAGLPALLATSANAAPATQLTIEPTNASAATGTCEVFLVRARDNANQPADTTTVTVVLTDPSPANNTPQGAVNDDERSAQFCAVSPDRSAFVLDPADQDDTGAGSANSNKRSIQLVTGTDGTAQFGVVDRQTETVTLEAFTDRNGDGTFDANTDRRAASTATLVFTPGSNRLDQNANQSANDAVRTITDITSDTSTAVIAPGTQTIRVQLRNANGDEVGGATPQILVENGGANSNGTAGNPTTGSGQRTGDSCSTSDNLGRSTCTVQVQNPGTDSFLIFVNQTNGGTPGFDSGTEPFLRVTRSTGAQPNTNPSDSRFIDLTPNGPANAPAGTDRVFTATVTDAQNRAVQGVRVDFDENGVGFFTADSDGGTIGTAVTNGLGRATVTLRTAAGETGQSTVRAFIASTFSECTQRAGQGVSATPTTPAGNCSDSEVTNFGAATTPPPGGGGNPPPASPTASPSVTPTASASPSSSPSGPPAVACTVPARVALDRDTITATGSAGITVTGTPNSVVNVLAYSRPSTTFRVVRRIELGADGRATDRIVPPTNTRLYAQQVGCDAGPQIVLNVRTALSLAVERLGVRTYRFSGDSLPARPGGLIISLYRVTNDGRQVLTAQTRASSTTGDWTLDRRFTGTGRFGFVVRTGQDLQNAPGSSNVRSLLVF